MRTLDPNLKMNPPLRTDDDRAALVAALLDGTIEAVATDHAPHSREEKDVPFEAAPFGVTGLETAFAALNTSLVEPGLRPARDAARADVRRPGADLRPRPAADRGRRAARTSSCSARKATWRVREDRFRSRSANSWLLGRRLHGKVAADGRRRPDRLRGMTGPQPDSGRGRAVSTQGALVLEDGTVVPPARASAPARTALGEAVFTTGMTGYQEVVTDPSFAGQLVCFTAPMVGNYGVADDRCESARPHARGVAHARGARPRLDRVARRARGCRR